MPKKITVRSVPNSGALFYAECPDCSHRTKSRSGDTGMANVAREVNVHGKKQHGWTEDRDSEYKARPWSKKKGKK